MTSSVFAYPHARRGLALPMVIFGLVAIGLLSAGLYVIGDAQSNSVKHRESSSRALLLAEEGLSHAVMVLRTHLGRTRETRLLVGSDNLPLTADDGLLIGYGLPADREIPDTGKLVSSGRYSVMITDDPADPDPGPLADGNFRVKLRCTGVTTDGSTAIIETVLASMSLPSLATEGNLSISGSPDLLGQCGGAHANGNTNVGGSVTVVLGVSASGTATGNNITNEAGNPMPPLSNQPPLEIPDYDPLDFCNSADYIMNANGWITQVATGLQFDARSDEVFGFKRASSSPIVWDHKDSEAVPGTFCAHGNVKIGGNPGTALAPLAMSIIATGSIEVSGNPYLRASHPEGVGLMSGGDLKINGNPAAGSRNFEGLMYSRSQCQTSGNPTLFGQLLCKNKANPAGSINHFNNNEIPGNPIITSDCNGLTARYRRVVSWYQPVS
jgi:hypothetical protein